jgi:hypothetical protein
VLKCSRCGNQLDDEDGGPIASMSGSFMGDEWTESYFFCPDCGAYTLEIVHDRFLDQETSSVHGPMAKEKGDALVALIRRCPEPWNKRCRCPAHLEYFQGQLD